MPKPYNYQEKVDEEQVIQDKIKQKKAIRNQYAQMGVEGYYKRNGFRYKNPHAPLIRELLLNNKDNLDYSKVLDLCCGSGEVTQVLQEMEFDGMEGCDPFTHKLYGKRTKRPCHKWDFKDIMRGKLIGEYSSIICSFGLHLADPKDLYALCQRLFTCSPQLVIITPHKRPVLEEIAGVEKVYEDFVLTERQKKVRLKVYSQIVYGQT